MRVWLAMMGVTGLYFIGSLLCNISGHKLQPACTNMPLHTCPPCAMPALGRDTDVPREGQA